MVTLSPANLQLTTRLISRHREAISSLWRKLNPGQQALLALVYLRKHETYTALAEGGRIGQTTAWRYVQEVVRLLEALAPSLTATTRSPSPGSPTTRATCCGSAPVIGARPTT